MSYELEVITKLQMGGDVVVANNIEESGRIDIEKQLYFCREIISTTDQSNRDNNLQLYKKVIEYLDKKDNVSLYAELENDQINYLSSKLNINPNWIDRLRFQFVAFLLGYVNLTDKNVFFLDEIKKGNTSIKKSDSSEDGIYELVPVDFTLVAIYYFCI